MSGGSPFSKGMVGLLIAVGFVTFFGAAALMVVGDDAAYTKPLGSNVFSESAVGHRAFSRLLGELGVRTLISRHDMAGRIEGDSLMIVAEPLVRSKEDVQGILAAHANVLLVLPKRRAKRDRLNPQWAGETILRPLSDPDAILDLARPNNRVERFPNVSNWRLPPGFPEPTIGSSIQLMIGRNLNPIISTKEGILLGDIRVGGRRVTVLSDPDILENHGLHRGDNALLAVKIVQYVSRGGIVVFDETAHGHKMSPNLWRTLFTLPWAAVTVTGIAALLILIWMSLGRFGAPRPRAPNLKTGKGALIDNTAELLLFGSPMEASLDRYRTAVRKRVEQRLHLPATTDGTHNNDRLDAIGEHRETADRFTDLSASVDTLIKTKNGGPQRLLATARRLWTWEQEISHGARRGSSHRTKPQG